MTAKHRALPRRDASVEDGDGARCGVRGRGVAWEFCGSNGGRARAERVGNPHGRGGQASRRVRGPAAHRAADRAAACKTLSVCYLPCRAPRRWCGGASRESRRTGIAPYRDGTRQRGTRGEHEAKPRTAPMARRREPGVPAAKHRALPRRGARVEHGGGAREWGASEGHERGVWRGTRVRSAVTGCGARRRG